MAAITKSAIKAIKFYKHVVQSVEKFIHKVGPLVDIEVHAVWFAWLMFVTSNFPPFLKRFYFSAVQNSRYLVCMSWIPSCANRDISLVLTKMFLGLGSQKTLSEHSKTFSNVLWMRRSVNAVSSQLHLMISFGMNLHVMSNVLFLLEQSHSSVELVAKKFCVLSCCDPTIARLSGWSHQYGSVW